MRSGEATPSRQPNRPGERARTRQNTSQCRHAVDRTASRVCPCSITNTDRKTESGGATLIKRPHGGSGDCVVMVVTGLWRDGWCERPSGSKVCAELIRLLLSGGGSSLGLPPFPSTAWADRIQARLGRWRAGQALKIGTLVTSTFNLQSSDATGVIGSLNPSWPNTAGRSFFLH